MLKALEISRLSSAMMGKLGLAPAKVSMSFFQPV